MRTRKRFPFAKKPTISPEEWERIREESEAAQELLSDPRFLFLRQYLDSAKASITDHFVNNRIKAVSERIKVSDTLTRVLTTTRAEQEQELSGRYKFIEELLADLEQTARLHQEYQKAQAEGKIVIEEAEEK
jgi:hypothetical protein